MKTLFVLFSLLSITTLSNAQYIMTHQTPTLSIGPDGIEAIATSPNSIDIYLPPEHETVSIFRDGVLIATVEAGKNKFIDSGLRPDTIYTYCINLVDGTQTNIAEKTYPVFQPAASYDVIVVGGTASGTAAAVAAARLGTSVALIEETNRIGGMASNGVSISDIRDGSRSNGFFEEFRSEVIEYYGTSRSSFDGAQDGKVAAQDGKVGAQDGRVGDQDGKRGEGLRYEPRVANSIMKAMVYAEPEISLFRKVGVVQVLWHGPRVAGVTVQDLQTGQKGDLYARVVIDATVEADVAAAAGVEFRIPREARSCEEPHAGRIYYDNKTDEILPGSTGEADNRIQSYAYLLTVKDYGADADKSGPPPPFYNAEDYKYSPPWQETWAYQHGRLPNDKFEINQHPWGGDLPGINYNYPYLGARERAEIAELYKWRALGYLHYIQTELGMKSIGLADDEYPDNCSFPPTLYDREARRMIGRACMDEFDVSNGPKRWVPTSIAIGDYPMDSHATRQPEGPDVRDRGEGEFWLVRYTPWYKIPLGILIPKDTPGLLVSTAVSATHVAYGTLRMEPVRMSLGQAAGTLAGLACRYGIYPTEFNPAVVQDRLLEQKAYVTWFSDVDKSTRHFRAVQFLTIRGFFCGESFRPEDNLSKEEAIWLTDRLVQVEKSGTAVQSPCLEPEGGSSISRAEFAQLLVSAKCQIDPDWAPISSGFSHYADIQPDTPISNIVEALFRHRIDSMTWAGPTSFTTSGLFFHPNAPITRADAAQAIWLADRVCAMRSD